MIHSKGQLLHSANSKPGIICGFWVSHQCPQTTHICWTCRSQPRRQRLDCSSDSVIFPTLTWWLVMYCFVSLQSTAENNKEKKNRCGEFYLHWEPKEWRASLHNHPNLCLASFYVLIYFKCVCLSVKFTNQEPLGQRVIFQEIMLWQCHGFHRHSLAKPRRKIWAR